MADLGRIRRAVAANSFGQFVQVLLQVIVVPVYILSWGVAQYADWILLTTVPAYLATSDLGLISAASNELSIAVGDKSPAQAQRTFQTSWVFASLTSIGLTVGCVAVAILVGVNRIFALKSVGLTDAALCLCVLGAYAVVSQQQQLLVGGLRAIGRNASGISLLNLTRLAETLMAGVSAALGSNIVEAACVMLVFRCGGVLAELLMLRRAAPWLRLGFTHAKFYQAKMLVKPSLGFIGLPIGNLITLQGFIVILSHGGDGGLVVAFSLVRTLSRFGTQLISVLEISVWPEMSFAFGQGRMAEMRRLHNRACGLSFYVSVAAALSLILLGPTAVRIWIGETVNPPSTLFVLLAIDLVLTSLWSTSMVVPAATNSLARVAVGYIIAGVASLLVLLPLVSIFGVDGAGLAMILADLLMIPVTLRFSTRFLGETYSGFLGAFRPRAVLTTARNLFGAPRAEEAPNA